MTTEIKPLEDEEIVTILEQMRERGDKSSELSANRKAALDYFYMRPRGDEITGRSQVQSGDVADMTESIMSQMLPSFTGDKICEFEPDGQGDEPQARLETDATNRAMMESSRGYVEFNSALKDALLLKGGILKGWIEEKGKGKKKTRRLRLKSVDPTCFGVGVDHDSPILTDCALCWEIKTYTRGELKALGFDLELINEIPVLGSGQVRTDQKRRAMQQQTEAQVAAGWAMEEVEIVEYHAELDCEGTGVAELYRILIGHKTLLLKEPAAFIPYAAGAAWLEPHSFWGLSCYDKLKGIQDIKTAIFRQAIDNLINCNFPRTYINDKVNRDDFVTPRSGGGIGVEGSMSPAECAMPVPPMDTGQASLGFLQAMNQVRAERAGASLDLQKPDSQILKSQAGADNIGTILGNAEMIAGMLARNLAETLIRSAFMLVHQLLRTEYGMPLNLRYADQWVTVDPRRWKARDRVNIKAGLSPSERRNKAANLSQIMQGQMNLAGQGLDGILVTAQNLHTAFLDWAAASEIDGPEKYITNPDGPTSKQAAMQKGQQGQQNMQLQAQLAQVPVFLEKMKQEAENARAEQELKFKVWEARLHAEIEEAKLIGTATADLNRIELEGQQAAANSERETAAAAAARGGERDAA